VLNKDCYFTGSYSIKVTSVGKVEVGEDDDIITGALKESWEKMMILGEDDDIITGALKPRK